MKKLVIRYDQLFLFQGKKSIKMDNISTLMRNKRSYFWQKLTLYNAGSKIYIGPEKCWDQ